MISYVLVTPKGERIVIRAEKHVESIEELKQLIEKEYGYAREKIMIKLKKSDKKGLAGDFFLEGRTEFAISNLHFSAIKKIKEVSGEFINIKQESSASKNPLMNQDPIPPPPEVNEELVNNFVGIGYPSELVIEACKKFSSYAEIEDYLNKKQT